jgi:16S rRNA (cytosine967-C5)-methyltransferase
LSILPPLAANSRQTALAALRDVVRGAYADTALEKKLKRVDLSALDRHLTTELFYGTVRRQRTLNALIDRLTRKPEKDTSDLRLILQIGLYQLRYMDRIPESAAVNTTVELAKQNGLKGLAPVVNGILRQYIRQADEFQGAWDDSASLAGQIAVEQSFPDWLIAHWLETLGEESTIHLCQAFNQSPSIDLRVNQLQIDRDTVLEALTTAGITAEPLDYLTHGIRLTGKVGAIPALPGYDEAWWTVQESSAQLVTMLLDPQPGEVIADACAAPGGKTTHIAELMGDRGVVWSIDPTPSRLKKITQNCQRLGLTSVQIREGDSRSQPDLVGKLDRVLLDAPCSGLGTLHRRADARWRKTPADVLALSKLQKELLASCASWVKPGGVLVYATCTVHPAENEEVILPFLEAHPAWRIDRPQNEFMASLTSAEGWMKTWLHEQQMDGFFMVRLVKGGLQ